MISARFFFTHLHTFFHFMNLNCGKCNFAYHIHCSKSKLFYMFGASKWILQIQNFLTNKRFFVLFFQTKQSVHVLKYCACADGIVYYTVELFIATAKLNNVGHVFCPCIKPIPANVVCCCRHSVDATRPARKMNVMLGPFTADQ